MLCLSMKNVSIFTVLPTEAFCDRYELMESIAGFSVRQSGCASAFWQKRANAVKTAVMYLEKIFILCCFVPGDHPVQVSYGMGAGKGYYDGSVDDGQ